MPTRSRVYERRLRISYLSKVPTSAREAGWPQLGKEYNLNRPLEALRALCALAVVTGHVRSLTFGGWQGGPLVERIFYALTSLGRPSVMVFFVLSGYWVGGPCIRSYISGSFSWRSYLLARLSRLWIVLLPTLLATTLLVAVGTRLFSDAPSYTPGALEALATPPGVGFDFGTLLGNVFFLQSLRVAPFGGDGPLWSLAFEFWFYLWCPLVLGVWKGSWRGRVGSSMVLGISVWITGWQVAEYSSIWLLGALVHRCAEQCPERFWSGRRACLVHLISLATLVLATICSITAHRISLAADIGVGIAAAAVVFTLARARPNFWPRPITALGCLIAPFSYSLYAIHLPVLLFLLAAVSSPPSHLPEPIAFIVGLCGAIAAGRCLYFISEMRQESVRAWLKKNLPGSESGQPCGRRRRPSRELLRVKFAPDPPRPAVAPRDSKR